QSSKLIFTLRPRPVPVKRASTMSAPAAAVRVIASRPAVIFTLRDMVFSFCSCEAEPCPDACRPDKGSRRIEHVNSPIQPGAMPDRIALHAAWGSLQASETAPLDAPGALRGRFIGWKGAADATRAGSVRRLRACSIGRVGRGRNRQGRVRLPL